MASPSRWWQIGGIKAHHVSTLIRAGADGVAVVSAINGAKDVTSAVHALLNDESSALTTS